MLFEREDQSQYMNRKLSNKHMKASAVLLCLYFIIWPVYASGETIQETLPSHLTTNAKFHQGEPSKPAVLILHGFLTTFNFNTVYGIFDLLAENGYTVLAPNLTLGINKRTSGLRCEAIHTQKMEDDLSEVAWWVDWLSSRGHKEIILIGHSIGSLHLIIYASQSPKKAVKQVIATGLTYFSQGDAHTVAVAKADTERAQKLLDAGDTEPSRYTISYCAGNFVAPPDVFLSYTRWKQDDVLRAIQKAKVAVSIILAGKDLRFADDWPDMLRKTGASVSVIKNASHFFDAEHEFELHDKIMSIIKNF